MPPTSATHPRPNSEVLPRVGAPPRAQRHTAALVHENAPSFGVRMLEDALATDYKIHTITVQTNDVGP
eukprot:3969341-Alexandrium_andersonii.AAC.1